MMSWWIAPHIIFIFASSATELSKIRRPLDPHRNRIIRLNSNCDKNYFNINLEMSMPFKGVIFAKDFSQECRYLGISSENATLQIPTSGCGVRLESLIDSPNILYYLVTLVIQQDRHLRQISDQEVVVKCRLQENAFSIENHIINEVLRTEMFYRNPAKDKRVGRMRNDRTREFNSKLNRKLAEALSATKAWMEIKPEKNHEKTDMLLVGEAAKLIFKTTLPVGIGWKVGECFAHDGLGESSQKLLDEFGCPTDINVMPAPKLLASKPISMMRHQEAVANFEAFKFPDRDRLHVSCTLQLCVNSCRKINCKRHANTTLDVSHKTKNISKVVDPTIDTLQVFNSVKVIAPQIEDQERKYTGRSSGDLRSSTSAFHSNTLGDKTFCVSADKMALAFAILGIIFLSAIIIVVAALLKGKRSNVSIPYYTRSLFSSSISSSRSGFGGSKLLFAETPPTSASSRQSSSQSFSYGRVY